VDEGEGWKVIVRAQCIPQCETGGRYARVAERWDCSGVFGGIRVSSRVLSAVSYNSAELERGLYLVRCLDTNCECQS
jgi:hypothetical protein